MPTFGSIVQKGKFAASAFAFSHRALNMVDLPTLGSPTIPALRRLFGRGSLDVARDRDVLNSTGEPTKALLSSIVRLDEKAEFKLKVGTDRDVDT
mmetsp:Transcript_32814/g.53232  ORF Transcript_32814/g.53232 Transcript_32814/m.53232 type:complete len:95 (-) Transcript_32814:193-477(-)